MSSISLFKTISAATAALIALTNAAPVTQLHAARAALEYGDCTLPSGLKWTGYCTYVLISYTYSIRIQYHSH